MAEGHIISTEFTRTQLSKILSICTPSKMLEIGFGVGNSAKLWLELSSSLKITSIDICKNPDTFMSALNLALDSTRFKFKKADSKKLVSSEYSDVDIIFIDGDHSPEGFKNDLLFAVETESPYILIDDYHRRWFGHIIDITKNLVDTKSIPYEIVDTYLYDCSDGKCTMALLKRID